MVNPWQKVLGVMLLAIVLTPFTVQAQEWQPLEDCENTIYDVQSTTTGTTQINYNATNLLKGFEISSSTEIAISKITVKILDKSASDIPNLYAHIVQTDGVLMATSTNYFTDAEISTSGSVLTFNFEPYTMMASTTYYVVVGDLVYMSTSNNVAIYYTDILSTNWDIKVLGSNYLLASSIADRYWGTVKTYCKAEFICPEGYECYTLEDMASTTEAIYAVGQMNGLYWAILFILIFGGVSFIFTRGYIK